MNYQIYDNSDIAFFSTHGGASALIQKARRMVESQICHPIINLLLIAEVFLKLGATVVILDYSDKITVLSEGTKVNVLSASTADGVYEGWILEKYLLIN